MPVIGAELFTFVAAGVERSLSGVEDGVVEGADVDLGMVTVLGVLVEFVPITELPVSGRYTFYVMALLCNGLARTR